MSKRSSDGDDGDDGGGVVVQIEKLNIELLMRTT